MAISRRPLDVDNYSALDGGNGLAVPGYYRRTNLNDIINNFIVAYIGDGKILTQVPRYEVAFWAQRSVQEFSYDVLHSEKSIEVEQNGIDYLQGIFGSDTIWKQCSFNTWKNKHKLGGTPLRYNMAEIGYTYDSLRDAFIPPKPGNGYILIEKTLQWTSTADFSNDYINRLKTYRQENF